MPQCGSRKQQPIVQTHEGSRRLRLQIVRSVGTSPSSTYSLRAGRKFEDTGLNATAPQSRAFVLVPVRKESIVECQIGHMAMDAVLSSEAVSMAVVIWIGRLVLVLAVVAFVLLQVIGAMITGFFRILGMMTLGWLVLDAVDDAFDCEV